MPEPGIVRRATDEARAPFDLARGPLFRTTLLRLDDQHHVLLVTLHHALADGWSVRVLVDEVAALSAAFAEGRPSPLPPLAVQYADFARWQRDGLAGEALEAHLAWWQERLAGVPVLDLPTDRPRPPVQTDAGDRVPLVLSPELTRQLHQLARDNGATLFMVLLAGFFLLLARWSGQRDFCVGTPVAGRDALALEPLIGFLVNTLVLRADLSGDPSFLALLARVRDTTLDAREHDEIPFDLLVDALGLKRDRSRSPLVQVTLTLQNVGDARPTMGGLRIEPIPVETRIAKLDLSFDLGEQDGAVAGEVEYNSDLYDRDTVERMAAAFVQLLESVVARPTDRIWGLPLLSAAVLEQHHRWRTGPPALPTPLRVHQAFEARAHTTPDALAVVCGADRLTYDRLEPGANQLAHHLRTLGVGPGVAVACVPRSTALVVGLLGVLKSGGAYVPLDPKYPLERLAFVLTDAAIAVVVTDDALADLLPAQHLQLVCVDGDAATLAAADDTDPAPVGDDHDAAYVIYTSGSTGIPKGVEVEHQRSPPTSRR